MPLFILNYICLLIHRRQVGFGSCDWLIFWNLNELGAIGFIYPYSLYFISNLLISVLTVIQLDVSRLLKELMLDISHLQFLGHRWRLILVSKNVITDLYFLNFLLCLPAIKKSPRLSKFGLFYRNLIILFWPMGLIEEPIDIFWYVYWDKIWVFGSLYRERRLNLVLLV